MKQGLALFDFDGTITSKDSLLEFIKFSVGKIRFNLVMGIFAPLILYYIFIKKDGGKAKQQVLSFLYKGWSESELKALGYSFAEKVIPNILKPKAIAEIEKFKKSGYRIVVISASLEIWLKPWTENLGVELICTRMKFDQGIFKGAFASANCNGNEKVNRIKALLRLEDYQPIYAYGNSSGDKPMLALADHGFYRHFE